MIKRSTINKLAVGLVLCSVLTGCHPKVDTTNPAVIKAVTLSNAEKTVNTIAHGLLAADQTLDSIKITEADYYASVSPKLKTLAKLNEVANQCIITTVSGGSCDWKQAVSNIAIEAGKSENLTSFGFKNPQTQEKVQLGFTVLVSGINMAVQFQQSVGGK